MYKYAVYTYKYFLNIYMHACIYICKIIIQNTHIYTVKCKHKLLFWMGLID